MTFFLFVLPKDINPNFYYGRSSLVKILKYNISSRRFSICRHPEYGNPPPSHCSVNGGRAARSQPPRAADTLTQGRRSISNTTINFDKSSREPTKERHEWYMSCVDQSLRDIIIYYKYTIHI